MQYEYAISDTAIAEKKLVYLLSLFARRRRDAFTVVVVLHLESTTKKVFFSFFGEL